MIAKPALEALERDIHHVFHPVDALFQRHDDAVHHSFGIGARIAGGYIDRGRCDVGILLHRQGEERDKPYGENQHGDGDSHHRPFDKYISFHNQSPSYLTCVPSRTSPAPSDTISSPAFRPSSTTYSRPSLIPATVIRVETALPSTTLYTIVLSCIRTVAVCGMAMQFL